MAVADLETGAILAANAALSELVGREPTELVGQPQSILYPDKRRSSRSHASLRVQRDLRSATVDKRVVTRDGTTREVEIRAALVDYRGRKGLLRVFSDTSADQHLERKVARIADAVSSAAGARLFLNCALALADAADADGVILAAFDPVEQVVNPLATAPREWMTPGLVLDGRRAPWVELAQGKTFDPSSRVTPALLDRTLAGLGTQAVLGVPLWDAGHQVMGCLVALYTSSIRRPGFALSAVRIVAARAGAELERLRDEPSPADFDGPGRYNTPKRRPSVKLRTTG
jgi:PAS domain S-box-containing protein